MLDIMSYIPAKRKQAPSGWVSFNAPCCHHRGEKQDKRGRGGIMVDPDGSWRYHCFNCRFTAGFEWGKPLMPKTKKLLEWLGVDTQDITKLNLEILKHRSIHTVIETRQSIGRWQPNFEQRDLPDGLTIIDPSDSEHQLYVNYLRGRGIDPLQYPFMVSPDAAARNSKRIVMPYTYNDAIVGYSARFLDDRKPKYFGDVQHGYVFGTDLQKETWTKVVVVEGIFDALSIGGVAVLHNDINDNQADLIRMMGRQIIVVPDQDKAGIPLIDRAIQLGWSVSIPPWPDDCKDVNDAVVRFGKLVTLMSILEWATTNKIRTEMSKKKLINRIKYRYE